MSRLRRAQRAGGGDVHAAYSRSEGDHPEAPAGLASVASRTTVVPGAGGGAAAVNGFAVLEAVLRMPVSTWSYTFDAPHVRHLGPMAQDWWAAFGLGGTDRAINCTDTNGVALVCIQGLDRKITALREQVAELQGQLRAYEQESGSGDTKPAR